MTQAVSIFWFRRDLRLNDNRGLYQAFQSGRPVIPIFIFDSDILDNLEDNNDARVSFIHEAVNNIQRQLLAVGSTIDCRYGRPLDVFKALFKEYQVAEIFCNHDYEPYAQERDEEVMLLARQHGAVFNSFKDQVIFEKLEVAKDDGKPYTVFTPYSRKWKSKLASSDYEAYKTEKLLHQFLKQPARPIPSLKSMGFIPSALSFPSSDLDDELVRKYQQYRDLPAQSGTSRLGVHLRFGTVSIRELIRRSLLLSEVFLNELIWREFYQQILANFPQIGRGKSFKPAYDAIEWRNNESEFAAWCNGETGFPIIDAGIRELNHTGFMHNRVRMIVASFLSKDLLIDWRWGEAYFARKLLDYDFASNNGGWQWAAGSGCDAAPYFRVFNPQLQTLKFDKKFEYIRKWVPEFDQLTYVRPIVDHDFARKRCLQVYAKALDQFR